MNSPHVRLWLYIVIGVMPNITQWLVLTYDTSLRGLLIVGSMTLTQAAITARAYLDQSKERFAKMIEDAERSVRVASGQAAERVTETTLQQTTTEKPV